LKDKINTKVKPGLATLYDVQPGNLFLQPWGSHRTLQLAAKKTKKTTYLPRINHHNPETDIYDMNNSRNKPSKRASNNFSSFTLKCAFMLNENSGFKHQLNHASSVHGKWLAVPPLLPPNRHHRSNVDCLG